MAVGGPLVHQREGFTAPGDTAVELGVGLRKCVGRQICATQIEVAEPGVEDAVGLGQNLDRLARLALLQRDLPLDDPAVRLRFGRQL
jgi:hypothetical protein